jgi:hypothetical protein
MMHDGVDGGARGCERWMGVLEEGGERRHNAHIACAKGGNEG